MPARLLCLALLLVVTPLIAHAQDTWTEPKLKIHGLVLTSEGNPAANIKVVIHEGYHYTPAASGQTGADGKFELQATAANHSTLIAYTPDLRESKTLTLRPHLLRTSAAFELKLVPNRFITCKFVDRSGAPVAGVQVSNSQLAQLPSAKSDTQGLAQAPLSTEWLQYNNLAGWTAKQGVFVTDPAALKAQLEGNSTEPLLFKEVANKKPLTVKVIDENDQPVRGVSVMTNAQLIDRTDPVSLANILDSRHNTNENGEAIFEWFPEHKMAWAHVDDPKWMDSGMVRPKNEGDPFILRVVSRVTIAGKIQPLEGADVTGMLVAAFGIGLGASDRLDATATRCDRDGNFQLPIAANHLLITALQDRDFASPYLELITPTTSQAQNAPIELKLVKGVPVRITISGYDQKAKPPEVSIGRYFLMTDPTSKVKRAYTSTISIQQPCNDQGVAEFTVFPGKYTLRATQGEWLQDKEIDVEDSPFELTLKAPQFEAREVQGKLLADAGLLKSLTGKLNVKAVPVIDPANDGVGYEEPPSNEVVTAEVNADGSFSFEIPGDWASLFIASADGKWFATNVVQWSEKPVELKLEPAASYAGTLLDANNKPIPSTKIFAMLQSASELFETSVTTDAEGKFTFPSLPGNCAIHVRIETERSHLSRALEAGEKRIGAILSTKPDTPAPRPPLDSAKALADRVADFSRDAHFGYMPALVILEGPEPQTKKFVEEFVLDFDSNPVVFEYFPLRLGTARLSNQELADWVKEQLWSIPKPGQISLIVLDGKGKLTNQSLFAVSGDAIARKELTTFLKKHALPKRNALTGLDAMLTEAKKQGKKVIVKHSGTRCAPCILLTNWLHEHHDLLDKDYLHFDFDWSRDEGGIELAKKIGADKEGIPFWAILGEDGDVLLTSKSLIGNIGMPSGLEAKRHVQKMLSTTAKRLTKNEIDDLIATLEDE